MIDKFQPTLIETVEVTREATKPSLKNYQNFVSKFLNQILEHKDSLDFVAAIKNKINSAVEMIATNDLAHGVLGEDSVSSSTKLYQILEFIASDLQYVCKHNAIDFILDRADYVSKYKHKAHSKKLFMQVLGEVKAKMKVNQRMADRITKLIFQYN